MNSIQYYTEQHKQAEWFYYKSYHQLNHSRNFFNQNLAPPEKKQDAS